MNISGPNNRTEVTTKEKGVAAAGEKQRRVATREKKREIYKNELCMCQYVLWRWGETEG